MKLASAIPPHNSPYHLPINILPAYAPTAICLHISLTVISNVAYRQHTLSPYTLSTRACSIMPSYRYQELRWSTSSSHTNTSSHISSPSAGLYLTVSISHSLKGGLAQFRRHYTMSPLRYLSRASTCGAVDLEQRCPCAFICLRLRKPAAGVSDTADH